MSTISMECCYSSLVLVRFFREAALVVSLVVRWLLLPCYYWWPFSSAPSVQQDKTEAEARARHRAAAQEVMESLRVSTYGELAGEQACATAGAATCAVCLSEVGRRDSVRELGNCRHVFHRRCLDRWLDHDERLSCPLCRAPLLSRRPSDSPPPPSDPSWAVERLLYLFGDDLLVVAPPP
ncbi:hypothetical protein Cni_G00774 [Canna indica]|uniref:RING-type domain-containing protein n=1 Tax=Canna indica TaxID=4628 RepID=A0AAQ3JN14_9LILI|nr:hypothetical protein Cni_G00774 [Canna indica]